MPCICRCVMNIKRILLAALAAGAVALFVEPAAAQATMESSMGFFGGVVDFVTDCFSPDPEPTPTGEAIRDLGETIWDLIW